MSPRITVGLLAVLLALGVYVYYGAPPAAPGAGVPGGAPTPKPADPSLDLWTYQESDIQAIDVQRGGQQAGVKRNGEDWVLTPSGEPADRLRVNSLVFRVASVKATYRVPEGGSQAQYGLDTPTMTATFTLANGGTRTLTVGSKAPAESGTYVRKDGDTAIYLVSNALTQDLERIVTEPPRPASPTPLPSPSPDAVGTPGASPSPAP
ncbi:MAG: DUF4340 domain-containing protein [Chloroflexota bacterium]